MDELQKQNKAGLEILIENKLNEIPGKLFTPLKKENETEQKNPEKFTENSFKKEILQTPKSGKNNQNKLDAQDLNVTFDEMDSGMRMFMEAFIKMNEAKDFMRKTLRVDDERSKPNSNDVHMFKSSLKRLDGKEKSLFLIFRGIGVQGMFNEVRHEFGK